MVPMTEQEPTEDRAAAEVRAAGELAAQGLRGFLGVVRDTHAAIAQTVAEQLPPEAQPYSAMERDISAAVYEIASAVHGAAAVAAGEAAAASLDPGAAPLSSTPAGAAAQAAVNALWGDGIEAQQSPVAVPMAFRAAGADVPPQAVAPQQATGDLVVFVHGLGEDERAWHLPYEGDPTSYGDRLASEHGLTALAVRYNTGLHISDNGERLGGLIDALVAAWPVPVASLSVVGHSMGGLVSRSAVHLASERGAVWVPVLRSVVSLGSPHLGAPLEQGANALADVLRRAPETEALSRLLTSRSAGIKDLRYGAIVSEDWAGYDPDEFLTNRCTQVPLLPHVTYYWVAATVTADPDHPLGRMLGDGLVCYPSAAGADAYGRIAFPMESGVRLTSINHLRLLNHPDVYARLADWLT